MLPSVLFLSLNQRSFSGSCFFFGKWRSLHSERCLRFWLLEVQEFSFVTFPSNGDEYIPCFLVGVLLQERYGVIIIKRGSRNQFTGHIGLSYILVEEDPHYHEIIIIYFCLFTILSILQWEVSLSWFAGEKIMVWSNTWPCREENNEHISGL